MSDVNILIIEDEALVALDIARQIKKLGYGVAGIKGEFEDAIKFLKIHSPSLILCDIMIDGEGDGIDIASYVQETKKIPLVFLSALSNRSTLERAKKTLPYGYIVKPFNTHDLLSAIEIALYKHSTEIEKLQLDIKKINDISREPLTDREYEILIDITKGYTNAQISESKFISVSTVKYHIGKLLEKLEVINRAEALHKIIELLTK